jgi:hypothetical protein
MQIPPQITVVHDLSRQIKTLFVDYQLVLQSNPAQGDPLYLIDEAAEHLASIHRVKVMQLTRH